MANNLIQIKRTSVSGRAANTTTLTNAGELALNMTDGIMYSTNGSVVFEIGANNTNARVSGNLTIKGIIANGSLGTSGYVLKSNGSAAYWDSDGADVGAANQILYRNSSNVLTSSSGLVYDGVSIKVNGNLESVYQNGSEGGEIFLSKPASGTTLSGTGVTIDIYENKIRFFENGGTVRGAYIDLTGTSAGVGTNLVSGGGGGSVNTSAQYTWSNTHIFQANVAFNGNNITVVSNTGSVMFAGTGDTNWRIGRSTGAFTKRFYSNNTLDFIAANSNLEGIAFGYTGSEVYLETGYAGTYTVNPIYIGNTSVNVSINSTSFSGTSNNASNLGGTAAANFVQNTDSRTLSGNLVFSAANVAFTGNARLKGVIANGSLGTAGQILASNGTAVYWTSDQGANAVTANTLSANYISVSVGTITVGNSTVNTDIGNNYVSVGNSTSFANVYSTFIRIGNSTVTSTINSTSFTGTANNATNLNGVAAASYVQNTDSRTLSGNLYLTGANNSFSGNLTIESTGELIITSGAGIYANGTLGTANQVLTTNGTTVYWANAASGGGFSNGQSISVNNFVVTGSFTANGSTGSAGQFLISSGSGVYWASTGNATSQSFTGNGSNTVFSLSQSISDQNNILITLDGLVQIPNTHYSISGNTLTFTDAPLGNTVIEARTLGAGVGGGGGGAVGGGSDQVFYQNDTTITTDYTITTNKNAMTAGPITINTGVTVTIPSGSTWTIV